MHIDVICTQDGSPGWGPLDNLADLAARLYGGQVLKLPKSDMGRVGKLLGLRARRKRQADAGLLVLLRYPNDLYKLRRAGAFRAGYGFVAVWMFDSFWHDRSPPARAWADIDQLILMRPEDMDFYRGLVGDRVQVLHWGADVLHQGSGEGVRPVDVQRLGRQPPEWEDDAQSAAACAAAGLRFAGRPELSSDTRENQRRVMAACADTKFLVAHSNLAAPAPYTHPETEYITARWTDTVAAGAIVAGVQPWRSVALQELFWPGALLDFDRIDLRHNVAALAEAVQDWRPERAAENHRMALSRLDWRWRLRDLAAGFGLQFAALEAELDEIRRLTGPAPDARRIFPAGM